MNARRVSLLMLVILGLIIMGGFGIYSLIGSELEQYSIDIQTKRATLNANRRQLRNTQQAAARLNDLQDVRQAVDEIIPTVKGQSDTIADVTALANTSGISVESISFAASGDSLDGLSQTIESELPGLRELPVTVRGEGSYTQLLEFIQRIENNKRKATIESLNISPRASTNDYDINIVINFYVRTQ